MVLSKRLIVLVVILLAAAGYYGYVLLNKKIPCVTPLPYALLSFDEKFGIPKAEAEADLKDAAAVWNNALGRVVLVEASEPELPVYFDYDLAQLSFDRLTTLGKEIDTLKAEQDAVAKQYTKSQDPALIKKFYDLKAQIEADVAAERNVAPSKEIEEGRFISDDTGTRIYVYGFKNKTELMRTLIHEFGHALGLEHVSNQDSIMYPSNTSSSLVLSKEDLTELRRACNLQ